MSTHLLTVAGIRSKSALHVLLYEKALRLPVGIVQHNLKRDDLVIGKPKICHCWLKPKQPIGQWMINEN